MALFGRETERDREKAQAYADWTARQNVLAIVSLVLGVFSLIELNALVFPGVAGLVLGVLALRQLSRPRPGDRRTNGRGVAWGGIITSTVGIVLGGLLYRGVFGA